MKYQESGVTYENVKKPTVTLGATIRSGEDTYNVSFINSLNPNYVMTEEEKGENLLNAIDIDWCGADINGTKINTTGELLSKVIEHDKKLSGAEDSSVTLPATIVAYFSEEKLVESKLDTISGIKTFEALTSSFAINDNSIVSNFIIDRASEDMYSVVAWPKSYGTIEIPEGFKKSTYTTEYKGEIYLAIVSNVPNKAFLPIVVRR